MFALLSAGFLVGGGSADGGVKGDIAQIVAGRARLDIAATLALGTRAGAAPAAAARDLVKRVGQLLRRKGFLGRVDLLAPVPPARVAGIEDILRAGFCRLVLRLGLADLGAI